LLAADSCLEPVTSEWRALFVLVDANEIHALRTIAERARSIEGRVLGTVGLFKAKQISRQQAVRGLAHIKGPVQMCFVVTDSDQPLIVLPADLNQRIPLLDAPRPSYQTSRPQPLIELLGVPRPTKEIHEPDTNSP